MTRRPSWPVAPVMAMVMADSPHLTVKGLYQGPLAVWPKCLHEVSVAML
jgi:hypothetical protein